MRWQTERVTTYRESAESAAQRLSGDPRIAGIDLRIEQTITDGTDTLEQYVFVLHDGDASVIDGDPSLPPHVSIRQDAATAAALHAGDLHAQQAFLTGSLTIDGDVARLIAHADLLAELGGPGN